MVQTTPVSVAANHLCTAYVSMLVINQIVSRCKIKGSMAAKHFMYSICIHASVKPNNFTVTNQRVHGGDALYVSMLVINQIVSRSMAAMHFMCIHASDKRDSLYQGTMATIHFMCVAYVSMPEINQIVSKLRSFG